MLVCGRTNRRVHSLGAFARHFFDGFHYATGLLLIRLAVQMPWWKQAWVSQRRLLVAAGAICLLLSLGPHVYFRMRAFVAGHTPHDESLFSTVAPVDEPAAIAWMREHASPDQLVLAPLENAAWFATVPMHSFASHGLSSLTPGEQGMLAGRFYAGSLDLAAARKVLFDYGVRYVVVPDGSPALRYLADIPERVRIGAFIVKELPGNSMKSYLGAGRSDSGANGF